MNPGPSALPRFTFILCLADAVMNERPSFLLPYLPLVPLVP